MKSLPSFFVGTTNPYKIREIASILGPLQIDLSVTDPIDPEETGDTFMDNACLKARAYSAHVQNTLLHEHTFGQVLSKQKKSLYLQHLKLSRVWTICEDSGIVIPALQGLPGPWSARFADCEIESGRVVKHLKTDRSREEIDLANNQLVLSLLQGVEQPYRVAKFVVAFVVADIFGWPIFRTESEITGWIIPEMRGENGFGYDPIFVSDKSFGKSYAEIDSMRKNLFSHRRKALQDFTTWLAGQIR